MMKPLYYGQRGEEEGGKENALPLFLPLCPAVDALLKLENLK